jgi:hypothetical protein
MPFPDYYAKGISLVYGLLFRRLAADKRVEVSLEVSSSPPEQVKAYGRVSSGMLVLGLNPDATPEGNVTLDSLGCL